MTRKTIRLCAVVTEFLLAAALLLALAPTTRAEGEPDRILNIYKSTGDVPLADIEIEIYQASDLPLSPEPTGEEIARLKRPENLVTTLLTDVQGFAAYNFTENGWPDGTYLVAEKFNPATTGPVEPFYISLPTAEGDSTLDVHLKGTLETGPDVNVDVISLENDTGTFAVGQSHTWILRGGIPNGIGTARSYVLTHVLDKRLSLEPGIVVNFHTADGRQLTLRSKEHYQLEQGMGIADRADRLRLALTPEGMAYISANLGTGKGEIRLSFRASINRSAQMGATIPGKALLTYTNADGVSYEAESDRPEVHTGGIRIAVTDGKNPLPGARFRLARRAGERDEGELLYIDGKKEKVAFVPFFDAADLSGEPVTETAAGADGRALAYGLAYGEYYLVQTEAPRGCNRVTVPIPVTVNEFSHLSRADGWQDTEGNPVDSTINVVNTKFVLPETGGVGTTVFAAAGIGMIGAACLLLLRRKRP